MVQQHHADGRRPRFGGKALRAQAREVEAGHHVRNDDHEVAVDLADSRLAVGRVGDREQRVGVGVVDVFVGEQRVQDRLDRRRRGARPRHVRRQLVDHVEVGQRRQLREAGEVREAHRREPGFGDRGEVPAAALDVEDVLVVADQVALAQLDRRVAAAVQHERAVAAEQARRVAAQRELARLRGGVVVVPAVVQADSPWPARAGGPSRAQHHGGAAGAASFWASARCQSTPRGNRPSSPAGHCCRKPMHTARCRGAACHAKG